jgi:glycosyltransferase involved in cell wall biosynthesis
LRVGLVIYGDLTGRSGGYLYDRMLVDHLEGRGDNVEVVGIPGRCGGLSLLKNVDPGLLDRLTGLEVDILVEDELCHHALCLLNARLKRDASYPLVGLVHHLSCLAEGRRDRAHRHEVIERRFLSSVDGYIFNSVATAKCVQGFVPHAQGVVARPGKDHVLPRTVERTFSGTLAVLYVGNILPHKGLDILIKAVSRLPRGQVTVDVAGPAVDHRYLREVTSLIEHHGLKEEVRFHGWVDTEERDALMDKAHILVAPSRMEGYGLIFVEAMACGLPAIAPAVGGASENITHGHEGFLVAPGDHQALASYLAELDGDRELLKTMSHRARRRFDALPTWGEEMGRAREYLLSMVR